MAARMYRYVSCMGMLYRMSERNYIRMLKVWAKDGGADIEQFGVRMGAIRNVTDMDQQDALDILQAVSDAKAA